MEENKNIKKLDEDITSDEWDNIYLPIQENLERYMSVFTEPMEVADKIFEILDIKYCLRAVSNDPLILEKYK